MSIIDISFAIVIAYIVIDAMRDIKEHYIMKKYIDYKRHEREVNK